MKILFDFQAFVQRIGGVSRYHAELMKRFSDDVEVILPTLLSENIYLSELGAPHYTIFPERRSVIKENVFKALNIARSIGELKRGKYDLFHPTFLNPYFVKYVKTPVVSTMHDLSHEKFPNLLPKAHAVIEKRRQILACSSAIIAISKETKMDLMKFYNIPEDRIAVIYHGVEQTLIANMKRGLIENPYILYIGSRNTYKNFDNFLQAFSRVKKEIHLVCTGIPFNMMEQLLIHQLRLEERIHQMFVTNEDLNNLLCNALAFVYPSISEGFGLPILEAYRCGCPCIISDLMCFREVAGSAAIYFDPNSVDDIESAVSKTIFDSDLLSSLKEEGFRRMKLFTWEKTAMETEKVYRTLI